MMLLVAALAGVALVVVVGTTVRHLLSFVVVPSVAIWYVVLAELLDVGLCFRHHRDHYYC